ncbi:MAG: UDP-N-acetylmuramoyl-L-alanyl-D-glutamate--2,6-diaminopimelate ligase [Gemmatimonadales bacterium]|nr:MAG: UDP-N-acetylmuramoyl-L-alanyl-D-glutamate--2,6-diaminopimelate ligase [Gemmatimonadales bacterium]
MRTLRELADALRQHGLLIQEPSSWPEITGVADDSRAVRPGNLFCAVKGTQRDGHDFLEEAVERGAAAAVVSRPCAARIPLLVVSDDRAAVAAVASAWYGDPARSMRLIGVTGTNGKSTTVSLIRHLLNGRGDVGSVGTVGLMDGMGAVGESDLTTPGPLALHRALATLKARGVRTVVMEASSHALDQKRLEGLHYSVAVFTNLSHDHLDYHGDLAAYREAKLKLASLLAEDGRIVANADDPAWKSLRDTQGNRVVWFGRSSGASVRAEAVQCDDRGSSFALILGSERVMVRLPLLGDFNVDNALAASAAAWVSGISAGEIASRLAQAPQVPGRMEKLASGNFSILRDYAHTPDALERALKALRPITRGRLIVLFGCGGDRDRRKRPVMGRIAARLADLAIVTSDNPRTEDPDRIIDEIESGMEGAAHLRITDRREAIARAVALLESGDCLLLAGKGHETYQVVGTERLPMDEAEIVRAALEARSAA